MIKLNYRKTMLILGFAMFFTFALLAIIFFQIENKKNFEIVSRTITAQMDEVSYVLTDSLVKNDISSCIAYLDRQVIANDYIDSLTLIKDGNFLFSTDRGSDPDSLMADAGLSDISKRIYSKPFWVNIGGIDHDYLLVTRINNKMYKSFRYQLVMDTFIYCFVATIFLMLIQFIVVYFFYISSFKKFYNSVIAKDFSGKYHVHEVDTLNNIFRNLYNSLNLTNETLKNNLNELTYQKNLFQTLFNNLPVPVYFKDKEGRYQRVNKKFLLMHGLSDEASVIGKTVLDILSPEQAREFYENDMRVMNEPDKQTVVEAETLIPGYDKAVSLLYYKAALRDEKGSVSGLVTVMMDMTEERELEKLKSIYASQLEKERLRLSEMFKKHSAIMVLLDPDTGMIKDANAAAVNFYGYSYEELVSMNMGDINLMHQNVISVLQQAKRGEKNYFEYRHRCKDGTMKDVEIHSSPIVANDEVFLFVVIHDISVKKRHELISRMQLEISAAFLHSNEYEVFSHANRALLRGFKAEFGYFGYIDQDGSLVSPSLTTDIYDKCQMKNKNFVFPKESWCGIWGQSLKERRIIYSNGGLKTPVGHVELTNAMAVPIVYNDQLLGQFTIANIDTCFSDDQLDIAENLAGLISPVLMHWNKNKYHEENLLKEKHDLELAVAKEMELKNRGEQILFEQKKFADMGQMINAIAHQWRQPLNALAILIQDIPDSFRENEINQDYLEDYVQNGVKLINHMSDTIDHFRDFFMPDKDKVYFDAVIEIINLFRLINIQLKSKDINVRITCRCDKKSMECKGIDDFPGCEYGETRIFGYIGEFKQSILNIIYNAVDAVKLYEEKHPSVNYKAMIDVNIVSSRNKLTISISDNGGGVDEKIMDQIFDPYFTTKPQGKGTGIGLYMTRLIIEKHMDGRIEAENVGAGARINIFLPVSRD